LTTLTKSDIKLRIRECEAFKREEIQVRRLGLAQHCLGVTQQIRRQIGKAPGDTVRVSLFVDNEARVVDIPADLQEGIHTRGLNNKS
jgi:hypothetical protein